jgi:hypothetical protein
VLWGLACIFNAFSNKKRKNFSGYGYHYPCFSQKNTLVFRKRYNRPLIAENTCCVKIGLAFHSDEKVKGIV